MNTLQRIKIEAPVFARRKSDILVMEYDNVLEIRIDLCLSAYFQEVIPFWKKCSKHGHKFEKKNVWHGKENAFIEESICSKCGFTLEPEQTTVQNESLEIPSLVRNYDQPESVKDSNIKNEYLDGDKGDAVTAEKIYFVQDDSLIGLSEDYAKDFLQNAIVKADAKIKIPHNGRIIELKVISTEPSDSPVIVSTHTEIHITTRQEIKYQSNPRPEQEKIRSDNTCATPDCKTKLHDLNSKHCKLCNQRVCIDHLQLHINKFCPKTMYVKYIRKLWLMKRGQNVSSGMYSIVCETCGYVSDFPQLIEYAGQELESHLDNSPECKTNKKTFLEELDLEPMPKEVHVESSIVRDPTRKLWVCAHCRPPRKFTSHDEYIAHHYTHS